VGVEYGIIDILNLQATIPEYAGVEKGTEEENEFEARVSLQEIKSTIGAGSKPSFNYFIFIILAALIAGVGLILDNPVIIIASMILSPLLGPVLGVSFGIISKNRLMIKNGLTSQVAGMVIAMGIGILVGGLATLASGSQTPTPEMIARTFPNYFDIIIAICSGIAVGFCITGPIAANLVGVATNLVGVAIAVALMPPAVNVGTALMFNDAVLALGSLLLLLLNILIINMLAILIFKLKKVTAPPKIKLSWRGPTEPMPRRTI
jgi:uncharacterized hydrophobic protein (TIGR00271 family)